jgi:hypothetical protein
VRRVDANHDVFQSPEGNLDAIDLDCTRTRSNDTSVLRVIRRDDGAGCSTGEFDTATIPGQPTTAQVMVKDSRHYASTGGWGFDRIINGQPVDLAQHQTCFACQES